MKQAILLAIAAALVALCTVLSPVMWMNAVNATARASARALRERTNEDWKWRNAQVSHDLDTMIAKTGAGAYSFPAMYCYYFGDEPAAGADGAGDVSPNHDFYLLPDAFVGGVGTFWLACKVHANATYAPTYAGCECIEERGWAYGERPADFTADGTLSLLTEGVYSGSTWTMRAPPDFDMVTMAAWASPTHPVIADVWYDHEGSLLTRKDVERLVEEEGGEVARSSTTWVYKNVEFTGTAVTSAAQPAYAEASALSMWGIALGCLPLTSFVVLSILYHKREGVTPKVLP